MILLFGEEDMQNNKKKQLLMLISLFVFILILMVLRFFQVQKMIFKPKAAGTVWLSFDKENYTIHKGQEATVTLRADVIEPFVIQMFKATITFDPTKLHIKENGIVYKIGQPSLNLKASTDSAQMNETGKIVIVGEIVDPPEGFTLAPGNADLVSLTFISASDDPSTISIDRTQSHFKKVKSDYTFENVETTGVELAINSPLAQEAKLNIKLKMQGITSKPKDEFNTLQVKVALDDNGTISTQTAEFTSNDNAVWSGTVNFSRILSNKTFKLSIKAQKHIDIPICGPFPYTFRSTPSGTYGCITLTGGENNLDLSNFYQLVGDLNNDGLINSYDLSLVRNNLDKSDADTVKTADLNLDGTVNATDFSLIIASMTEMTAGSEQ